MAPVVLRALALGSIGTALDRFTMIYQVTGTNIAHTAEMLQAATQYIP